MRFVPIKTDEQLDLQSVHRVRERWVMRRTAVINQIRSLPLERGITLPKGTVLCRCSIAQDLGRCRREAIGHLAHAAGATEAGDAPGSIRRSIRIVVRVRLFTVKTLKSFRIQKGEVNYTSRKVVSMAKSAPITIPTEPIGSIPRPVDLIERVAKGDREDPSLAPLYDDAIRDTI
jgi:hypothetical protein